VILVALLVMTAGFGRLSAQVTGDDEAVKKAEAERAAAIRAGDVSVMERVLAADYTEISAEGRIRGRVQALSLAPESAATEHPIVHLHQDAAVVVGREADARVLRVWVRQPEGWRLAAQQAAVIAPGAAALDPTPELLAVPHLTRTNEGPVVTEVLAAQAALDRAGVLGDAKAFESLTASDFVQVTSHGLVRAKAYRVMEERLRQLSNPLPLPIADRDDIQVRPYGTIAILTARNWPKRADGTPAMPTRVTRVWQNGPSGWQQVASIATFMTRP
jgi:hypothetical protein